MAKTYTVSFNNSSDSNPYLGKSKDELLQMYDPDVWDQMENADKLNLLEATGNVYAEEHGIEKAPVFVEEKDEGLYGGYTGSTNTVSINLNACKNPYEALDTVAHEVNHAYQKQSIDNKNGTYTEKELALLKAEDSAYRPSGIAYDRQSLEQDSNNAGIKYVLESKDNFMNRAAFQDYLHGREEHFNKVAEDYMSNYHQNCMSEIRQVEEAYVMGDIGKEERDNAISCIVDQENSVKSDLLTLQEEIQNVHYETAINKECQTDLKSIASQQHQKFDEEIRNVSLDKEKLAEIHKQNENTLKNLNYTNEALSKEYDQKFAELQQYITDNNMDKEMSQNDEKYQALSKELAEIQEHKNDVAYYVAELETDNQIINQNISEESLESSHDGVFEDVGSNLRIESATEIESDVGIESATGIESDSGVESGSETGSGSGTESDQGMGLE